MVVSYLINIGEMGIERVLKQDPSLARGVYIYQGKIAKKSLGERFKLEYKEIVPSS
jgi:alanine dehydrogenase